MKFSIVVPTRNRAHSGQLSRALNSLRTQTCQDLEVIVVDDGTKDAALVEQIVQENGDKFRLIRLPGRGRVIARNTGMQNAKGEWICWLDDDDEYTSSYLEALNDAMLLYPDAKCFNFGAILYHRRWIDSCGKRVLHGTSIRPTFRPLWIESEGKHEEFRSGKIGTGSFVFHREVYETIGDLPEASSPYKLHELAVDVHHLYPYPPRKEEGHAGSLGNPWGSKSPQEFPGGGVMIISCFIGSRESSGVYP